MHQTEIHAKLISIMGDRLTAHIESLKVRTSYAMPRYGTDDKFTTLLGVGVISCSQSLSTSARR